MSPPHQGHMGHMGGGHRARGGGWGGYYSDPEPLVAWCQDKKGVWAPCPPPYLLSTQVGGSGVGGILPRFVTSGDVADAKARLVPSFNATQADAFNCSKLDQATFDAWEAFYNSWVSFADEDEDTIGHFWTAGSRMDRVDTYAATLQDWQKKLSGLGCTLSGPTVQRENDPNAPNPASDILNKVIVLGVLGIGAFVLFETVPLWSPRRRYAR